MAIANGFVLALGGLLLLVPIALHFLMRPKPKQLEFPALQFVAAQQRKNKRQLRLKQWLLLLLRCLAVLAAAAALAQPSVASSRYGTWLALAALAASGSVALVLLAAASVRPAAGRRMLVTLLGAVVLGHLAAGGYLLSRIAADDAPPILGDRQAPVAAVIVVDTSPRMGYRSENQTRLEQAQRLAGWLISQLPLDSQVCIATADGDDLFMSVDLNAARRRLETLAGTYRRVALPQAIRDALPLLQQAPQERKELYVLTDLTRSSWLGADTRLEQALAAAPQIAVYLLDVGVEQPANLTLNPLELSASALTPASVLRVQAGGTAMGAGQTRSLQLRLELPEAGRPVRRDGVTLLPQRAREQTATVELSEGRLAAAEFQLENLPPGLHHGSVRLEGEDPLAADDVRFFTVAVQPAWPTLVVHPANVAADNLVQTLAPEPTPGSPPAEFACDVIDQNALANRSFTDYALVVLLNPEPIPDALWGEARRYVEGGGSLVIFLGHNALAGGEAAAEFRSEVARELLAIELTSVWRDPSGGTFLSPADWSHPILAEFRGRATSIRWNTLPVFMHWGVQPATADAAAVDVVLRYSNRRPAILERALGRGRIVLMTTPISEPPRPADHASWNALFYGEELWASWLLVREMMRNLVPSDPQQLNVTIDQPASLPLRRPAAAYWLFTPRDEDPLRVEPAEGGLSYRFTDTPGHYRYRDMEGGGTLGFSVNLEPAATDLARCSSQELEQWLGQGRFRLARTTEELQREQGASRLGQEFYPLLAVLLAVLLMMEHLVSNLFYATSAAPAAAARPAAASAASVR